MEGIWVSFTRTIYLLPLRLLVANFANIKLCIKTEKLLKPWHMGTYLRVLRQSYLMNTNMTGFRWFSKIFASLCFGQKEPQHWKGYYIDIYLNNIIMAISWEARKCEN